MLRTLKTFVLIVLAGGLLVCIQYGLLKFARKLNHPEFLRRGIPPRVDTFVFLKTHKTGSGTLTSIFSRYADTYNLQLALPMKEVSRFSWPLHFTNEEVDRSRLKREKANVLCHHAVFRSKVEFEKVMNSGAKYITILRNPVDRFESNFFYDKFDRLFKSDGNQLLHFLNVRTSNGWHLKNTTYEQKFTLRLFTNGMLFDLTGELFDKKQPKEIIEILIKDTENDFDYVMIMEYFDESLVLLRKYFSWTLLDIVYRRNHVRKVQHKELLTKTVRQKIIDINQGDIALYEHFLKIFKIKMKQYGEEFRHHLEIFRKLNKAINNECSTSLSVLMVEDLEDLIRKWDLSSEEYRMIGNIKDIPSCFCEQLHRDEVSYVKYFRNKYEPYYYVNKKDIPQRPCY